MTYTVGAQDAQTLDHTPVTRPERLDRHEAFVVAPAKKRPVVILSVPITTPAGAGVLQKDFPEAFLVAPLFSFKDTHSPEFRRRLEALEYNMLFFLPSDGAAGIQEGFLRFDRCQVVPKGHLRLWPYALTNDALTVIRYIFQWFTTDALDPDITEYRRIMLEAIERT